MTLWLPIVLVSIVMVLGLVRQIIRKRQAKQHLTLAMDFLETFIDWCNGGGADAEAYCWLAEKSELLQSKLGRIGLMDCRRPFENGYHHNYPVILNFLPDTRAAFQGDMLAQRNFDSTFNAIDNCLRRYIGVQEEVIQKEGLRLFNPAVWFGGGIAAILELVLGIVAEAAGIPEQRRREIVSGRFFSVVSGVVAALSFLSTVITILQGWNDCCDLVKRIVQ